MHTADNYGRIAGFVDGDRLRPAAEIAPQSSRALGTPQRPATGSAATTWARRRLHRRQRRARPRRRGVSTSRAALRRLAELTDAQLDPVPPERTPVLRRERALNEILASLLKHQQHQLDAVKTALT